jgi:hypothetical protein
VQILQILQVRLIEAEQCEPDERGEVQAAVCVCVRVCVCGLCVCVCVCV